MAQQSQLGEETAAAPMKELQPVTAAEMPAADEDDDTLSYFAKIANG